MAQAERNFSDAVSGLQPLSYLNSNQPANVLFVRQSRAPTTSDRRYKYGTIWLDTASTNVYCLVNVAANSASWALMSAGSSQVDTLTGDTGGALSPSGGNINILGGDNLTVDGSGSTLTINLDSDAYPITPYVVGVSGDAGYTTIQAALDAANAASGGIIAVQPGSYTEDLTLYADCYVVGLTNSLQDAPITITGVHTPPATGDTGFDRCNLVSATDIFNSAAAGTGLVYINNSSVAVTNGFIWNLPNWTGEINGNDIGDSGSTNNGVVSNSGAATVFLNNGVFGAGTGQTMAVNATLCRLDLCEIACPSAISGGFLDVNVAFFTGTMTISGSTTGIIFNALFATGANAAITYSTSGAFSVYQTIIDSSASPAIAGAGAGTLTLTGINFLQDATISASLTIAAGTTSSGTFNTLDQAAGLTISGDDIDADGTDANISITVSPKGTGDFIVDVGDIQATAGDIIASRSSASGDVTVECTNSDNTAADSDSFVEVAVGGTSGGNPGIRYQISGGQAYSMGIDNASANDDLLICGDNDIGTDPLMTIAEAGDVTVNKGNLILGAVATQLQMNGGAATDFIGTATLTAGTVTISNTNIAANDRIFIQRQSINGSTALGMFTYSISASTSFTITSVQPGTPASTETNDVSVVMYWIVREN